MILTNFKHLISIIMSNATNNYTYGNQADTYNRPLFKDWKGNIISFERKNYSTNAGGNFFQSTFCGLARPSNQTTSLPNTLSSEEEFLNNYYFCYGGQVSKSISIGNKPNSDEWSWYEESVGFGLYMVLGSGDTPPTKDDYKLDSFIPTTDLSITSYGCEGPIWTYPLGYFGSYTSAYINKTEKNITVKELGLARCIYSGNPNANQILMVREVLQNPVVIKPKEITTFTIVIK